MCKQSDVKFNCNFVKSNKHNRLHKHARLPMTAFIRSSLPAFSAFQSIVSGNSKYCLYAIQTRGFYRILTSITNRPDRDRIKELGPDRACAEWLLRCGATFKWKGTDRFQTDYHALPTGNLRSFVIEEVEAVEAGIMLIGFDHFEGCEHVRRVRFHHCPYIDDDTLLLMIEKLKGSLEQLELTSCGDITDIGLGYISQLQRLRNLILQDLPEVRNRTRCYTQLQKSLPNCTIDYKDVNINSA